MSSRFRTNPPSKPSSSPSQMIEGLEHRVLLSAFEQGIVQFAWVPPIPAARGVDRGVMVPVAVAVRSGSTSYNAALIAKKQGPIRGIEDLHDLRAAWVDRESAAGYVVIRAALRAAGVSLVSAFRDETFLRSHAEVSRAVGDGRADVGATFFK